MCVLYLVRWQQSFKIINSRLKREHFRQQLIKFGIAYINRAVCHAPCSCKYWTSDWHWVCPGRRSEPGWVHVAVPVECGPVQIPAGITSLCKPVSGQSPCQSVSLLTAGAFTVIPPRIHADVATSPDMAIECTIYVAGAWFCLSGVAMLLRCKVCEVTILSCFFYNLLPALVFIVRLMQLFSSSLTWMLSNDTLPHPLGRRTDTCRAFNILSLFCDKVLTYPCGYWVNIEPRFVSEIQDYKSLKWIGGVCSLPSPALSLSHSHSVVCLLSVSVITLTNLPCAHCQPLSGALQPGFS